MSETKPPAVYTAIAAVMAHMSREGISKSRRSGDGGGPKFQFRGIDDNPVRHEFYRHSFFTSRQTSCHALLRLT